MSEPSTTGSEGRKLKTLGRALVVNESVVYAELDDEAVLLNVDTGFYFGLNVIGTEIWNLLKQGASEGEIVSSLAAEYDVEPAQLRLDVTEFMNTMAGQGLVQAVEK